MPDAPAAVFGRLPATAIRTADMRKISIVTPCYNEERNVDECYAQVRALFEGPLKAYDYEHIFCDNSSADDTVGKVRAIASRDNRVKLIVNSRNFGAFANIFNGLTATRGDAVVVMLAADLQDPPAVMVDFVRLWEQGYEVIYGIRQLREEAWLLRTSRRIFYRLVNSFSPFFVPENVGEYQLIDRAVAEHVIKMDDHFPFVRGMIAYCGFKATGVPYTWTRRRHGVSSSTLVRLVEQGLNGIISFSNVPMRLVLAGGFVVAALSVLGTAFLFTVSAIYYRELAPPGVPLLMMMVTFFSGIFLFVLGFIGEYIVAIHSQVRKRPLVIERERMNFASSPKAPAVAYGPSHAAITDLKAERAEGKLDRNTFWRQASEKTAMLRQLQPMIGQGTVKAIEVDAGELRLKLANGAKFVWDPEDVRTAPNIALLDGTYESQELAVLSDLTSTAEVIFDVGANVGWYAIQLAGGAFSNSKIFCFEPVPSTRAKLSRNIRLNSLEDRIKVFDFGLSDKGGTAQFFLPEASGSVAASAKNLHPEEPVVQLEVRLETLDEVVAREQIDRVDLVKCDVEGAELSVLRGAMRVIERDKPIFFLEMLRKWARQFDYHPNDIIHLLAASGYRCWAVGDHALREIDAVDEGTPETNYLFLHAHHRVEMARIADGSMMFRNLLGS
jgi:polyisoprenyl-phosphate glycosyltransferase